MPNASVSSGRPRIWRPWTTSLRSWLRKDLTNEIDAPAQGRSNCLHHHGNKRQRPSDLHKRKNRPVLGLRCNSVLHSAPRRLPPGLATMHPARIYSIKSRTLQKDARRSDQRARSANRLRTLRYRRTHLVLRRLLPGSNTTMGRPRSQKRRGLDPDHHQLREERLDALTTTDPIGSYIEIVRAWNQTQLKVEVRTYMTKGKRWE